jgi:hypothetical protein
VNMYINLALIWLADASCVVCAYLLPCALDCARGAR